MRHYDQSQNRVVTGQHFFIDLDFALEPEADKTTDRYRQGIRDLLGGKDYQLPSLPESAIELSRLCNNPNADLGRLVEMVRADTSLATGLLKLANSVHYRGVGRPCDSVERAMVQVGLNGVRDMALAMSMRAVFLSCSSYDGMLRGAYRHSVAVATGCSLVARAASLDADGAYFAGLMHDVGEVIVLHALEKLLRQRAVDKLDDKSTDRIVDAMHEEAGGLALRRWKMPDALVGICEQHHKQREGRRDIVAIVTLVDAYARCVGLSPRPPIPKTKDRLLVSLCQLGLTLQQVDQLEPTMRVGASAVLGA